MPPRDVSPSQSQDAAPTAPPIVSAHAAVDPGSALPLWMSNPPPGVTWLSLILSMLALGWGVYEFVWRRRDRTHDHRREVRQFWFRELIFPHSITPITQLFANAQVSRRTLENECKGLGAEDVGAKYRAYDDLYKGQNVATMNALLLVGTFDAGCYSSIYKLLEEAEDANTLYCSRQSDDSSQRRAATERLEQVLIEKFHLIIDAAMGLHLTLADGRAKTDSVKS